MDRITQFFDFLFIFDMLNYLSDILFMTSLSPDVSKTQNRLENGLIKAWEKQAWKYLFALEFLCSFYYIKHSNSLKLTSEHKFEACSRQSEALGQLIYIQMHRL